jgi:hypothetical protein
MVCCIDSKPPPVPGWAKYHSKMVSVRPPRAAGHVRRHVVRIDVEHRVGEDPVVEGVLLAIRGAHVPPVAPQLLAGSELTHRSVLAGVPAERLHPIAVVVELPEQRGVGDRDVVALEVVVDVDLPGALDLVVAAFHEAHRIEVEAGRPGLLGDRAQHGGQGGGGRVEVGEDEGPERLHAHRLRPKQAGSKSSVASISGAARNRPSRS